MIGPPIQFCFYITDSFVKWFIIIFPIQDKDKMKMPFLLILTAIVSIHIGTSGTVEYAKHWRTDNRCGNRHGHEVWDLSNLYLLLVIVHFSTLNLITELKCWLLVTLCVKVEVEGELVPGHCKPRSPHGYSCCSRWGWCGASQGHCSCQHCVKYIEQPTVLQYV